MTYKNYFTINIIASSFGHQNGHSEDDIVGYDTVLLVTLWMDALRPFSSPPSPVAAAAAKNVTITTINVARLCGCET